MAGGEGLSLEEFTLALRACLKDAALSEVRRAGGAPAARAALMPLTLWLLPLPLPFLLPRRSWSLRCRRSTCFGRWM